MGSIPPETVICVSCDAHLFRSDKLPRYVRYYHNEGRSGKLDLIFIGDSPSKNMEFTSEVYIWMLPTMYFCFNDDGKWMEGEIHCSYVRCEECTEIIGRLFVSPNIKDGEYARFELKLPQGRVKVDFESSSEESDDIKAVFKSSSEESS